MTPQTTLAAALLLLPNFATFAGGDRPTPLDLNAKTVQRQEVNQTQIGFASTRVFYTLGESRVVVVLHVDNTKKEFPVTGKVCQFAKDTPIEGLAKWVNNQHSDGLFPDVPEPVSTDKLPADACRTLSSKHLGQRSVLDVTYDQFAVEIQVDRHASGRYRLEAFKDRVNVYVKAK